jgi:hypothetical protein
MGSTLRKDNYTLEPRGSRNDELFYDFKTDDESVVGMFGISGNILTIYEWCSSSPGAGNTSSALRNLLKTYNSIEVKDIGASPSDSSWQYWLHMRANGLVERLYDGMNELIS